MQIKEVEQETKKRAQYRKLISLNEQELNHQIVVSLKWMKYLYILLEMTSKLCKENDVLFFNLDLFEKVVMLRSAANEMRINCNLPPGHMIYEESDVDYILQGYKADESYFTKEDGSIMDGEEVANMLVDKYGKYVQEIKVCFSIGCNKSSWC